MKSCSDGGGTLVAAELQGARLDYGAVRAVDDLSLTVRPGEVLAILGPNGAGKSSAIGLMTGRVHPDAGRARIFGRDPRDPAARRLAGVMLQSATLPDMLRVGELVGLFSAYYPSPRPVAQTLQLAGLDDLASRRYDQLSGGQQRRVQFALAICGRPPLLFIDEPSTGLDADARRLLWTAVRAMRDEGAAVVLTTHYLEEADALADRILLIDHGRVVAEGTPEAIKRRASGSRIRCRTRIAPEVIAGWPDVDRVDAGEHGGGRVEVVCRAPEDVLRRLLAMDDGLGDLQVGSASLEQAVLSITARAPTEAA